MGERREREKASQGTCTKDPRTRTMGQELSLGVGVEQVRGEQ